MSIRLRISLALCLGAASWGVAPCAAAALLVPHTYEQRLGNVAIANNSGLSVRVTVLGQSPSTFDPDRELYDYRFEVRVQNTSDVAVTALVGETWVYNSESCFARLVHDHGQRSKALLEPGEALILQAYKGHFGFACREEVHSLPLATFRTAVQSLKRAPEEVSEEAVISDSAPPPPSEEASTAADPVAEAPHYEGPPPELFEAMQRLSELSGQLVSGSADSASICDSARQLSELMADLQREVDDPAAAASFATLSPTIQALEQSACSEDLAGFEPTDPVPSSEVVVTPTAVPPSFGSDIGVQVLSPHSAPPVTRGTISHPRTEKGTIGPHGPKPCDPGRCR